MTKLTEDERRIIEADPTSPVHKRHSINEAYVALQLFGSNTDIVYETLERLYEIGEAVGQAKSR